jgi:short-subunit dehydrogenase
MKALITGGSSGIGRDMATYLKKLGHEVIIVGSNKEKLDKVADKLNCKSIVMDLSIKDNCKKLYEKVKSENIDILINNAGFGKFGEFTDINLDEELNMIDVNINAVHILTKLFLKDFVKRDSGYILNVASSAAFEPGPLMATYYSTKAYVLRLTTSIYEELRRNKSNVHISVLCPGPVNTNFNNVANVKFSLQGLSSEYVAKYAIDQMLAGKKIIIPGFQIKALAFISKIIPTNVLLNMTYKSQKRKGDK